MKVFFFLMVVFLSLLKALGEPSEECIAWFDGHKLTSEMKDCLIQCSSKKVDMSTFSCTSECAELCKSSVDKKILFQYVYYPGLTSAEKAMIANYPKESLKVFFNMLTAERRTEVYFPKSITDDEGDAFRHYLWAGLLYKDIGSDLAVKFLEAHEENPLQKLEVKSMDLANNRAGIIEAARLEKNGKLTQENIENSALDALRKQKLILLKPQGKIPEGPKP